MTTLTIDLLNDKAINRLRDMEQLQLIRVRDDHETSKSVPENLITKYKGAVIAQSVSEVDEQLDNIRNHG